MLRNPVSAGLALLSWLIPLSALLPPATLSIENRALFSMTRLEVPIVNYTDASMIVRKEPPIAGANATIPGGTIPSANFTTGASMKLLHLAKITATQSVIQDFPEIGVNVTYPLEFEGSAVTCKDASPEHIESLRDFVDLTGNRSFVYYSWTPKGGNWTKPTRELNGEVADSLFTPPYGYANFFVASRKMSVLSDGGGQYTNFSILNCSLYHAMYGVTFRAVNGRSVVEAYTVGASEEQDEDDGGMQQRL